jgi:hypothetical protein
MIPVSFATELPTASVVRSSQATLARRRGQLSQRWPGSTGSHKVPKT